MCVQSIHFTRLRVKDIDRLRSGIRLELRISWDMVSVRVCDRGKPWDMDRDRVGCFFDCLFIGLLFDLHNHTRYTLLL